MYTSLTPTAPNGRHGRVAAPLHRAFDPENRCTRIAMRSERPIPTPPLFTPEELRRLVAEMID